jgi:hypothetical protein
LEFGPSRPITALDGRKFVPPNAVEIKAATDAAVAAAPPPDAGAADVPPPEALPAGTDATDWMLVPESTLTPEVRRAADLALEAAKLFMPGLPAGVQIRFIAPFDASVAKIYEGITGAPPAVFVNAKGTKGSYFGGTHAETVWVSVAESPTTVAQAVLHEAAHCWRQTKGAPAGWTREDKEAEADALTTKLLPVVEAAAVDEGGLGSWPAARRW